MSKVTVLEKNKMVELFKQGYNTVQIGKKINRHDGTVGKHLRKMGYKMRYNNIQVSPKEKEKICKLYTKKKMTTEEIAREFSCKIKTGNTISKILREQGVELREAKRIIDIEHERFFKEINNKEKAYILGMIIADGCISVDNRKGNRQKQVSIDLKRSDRYLLKKIKNIIGINSRKVIDYKSGCKMSRIGLTSNVMAKDLKEYGVFPNKSLKTFLPKLKNNNMYRHLIRGYFDGNGTVYISNDKYNTLHFGFYGTHKIVKQIQNKLIQEIGINNNKIIDQKTHNVSFSSYSRDKDINNFYNYIYKDAELFLKRKREKFEKKIS